MTEQEAEQIKSLVQSLRQMENSRQLMIEMVDKCIKLIEEVDSEIKTWG